MLIGSTEAIKLSSTLSLRLCSLPHNLQCAECTQLDAAFKPAVRNQADQNCLETFYPFLYSSLFQVSQKEILAARVMRYTGIPTKVMYELMKILLSLSNCYLRV